MEGCPEGGKVGIRPYAKDAQYNKEYYDGHGQRPVKTMLRPYNPLEGNATPRSQKALWRGGFAEGLIEVLYVRHVVCLLPVEHLTVGAYCLTPVICMIDAHACAPYRGRQCGGALQLYAEPSPLCAVFGIKAQKPLLRAGFRRKLYIQHGEEYGQYYEQPAQYGCGYFPSGRILAPLSLLIFKIISYFNTNRNTVPRSMRMKRLHGYRTRQGGQGTA